MQPGNRVQVIIKDPSGHRLVADSLPDGKNRSIVNPGAPGDLAIAASGLLQVHYTLRNGDLHQGIVELKEDDTVSDALMRYLQESEQIAAFLTIECVTSPEGVAAIGGFVVQVTPEATHEGLSEMTSHLEGFDSLLTWLADDEPNPESLIAEILQGHEYALLANSLLQFGCTCSSERMVLGLSTLARSEIADLLREGEAVEINCDACGERYEVSTDQLAELLVARDTSDSGDLPN
jgi:molecular chaperone Hsp33